MYRTLRTYIIIFADETSLSEPNKLIKQPESDYKSDPARDQAGNQCDSPYNTFMLKSDMEALDLENSTSLVATELENYPDTREPIGDVRSSLEECSNLCKKPWAPFSCTQAFNLASWVIESKVSKTRINEYFSSDIGNLTSVGCSSMHTLENHLQQLDLYALYL